MYTGFAPVQKSAPLQRQQGCCLRAVCFDDGPDLEAKVGTLQLKLDSDCVNGVQDANSLQAQEHSHIVYCMSAG